MNTALQISTETMSKLALAGDVGGLNPQEKIQYYAALCERVGLDPATQPFKLMRLSGKEVFYLDRSGAQQLNRLHQISHEIKTREFVNGCYVVTARASIGNRFTDSIGAVACEGLKGEALANATMKAETKAKRRATLDLVGLGMLDETEVETIPTAQRLNAELVPMPQRQIDDVKQAKVVETKPVTASDAHRTRLIELLTPLGPAALEYCQKCGLLLPTEELKDLPLRFVPATVDQKDAFMAAVQAFVDGGEAKKPAYAIGVPPHGEITGRQDKPDIGKSLENIKKAADQANAEPWRSFPMPFGKQAGVKLADLDKKYLFGLWANFKVETEYNGRPKKPETIAKDTMFRQMLDLCGQHYKFEKKESNETDGTF